MRYCPRTVALRDGEVVYDGPSAALTPALLRELYGAEADELLLGEAIMPAEAPPAQRRRLPQPAEALALAAAAAELHLSRTSNQGATRMIGK